MANKKYAEQDALIRRMNRRLSSYQKRYGTQSDQYGLMSAKIQAAFPQYTYTDKDGSLQLRRSKDIMSDKYKMDILNKVFNSTVSRQDFERVQARNIQARTTKKLTKTEIVNKIIDEQQHLFETSLRVQQALSYIYEWGYLEQEAVDWVETKRRGKKGRMDKTQVGELLNITDQLKATVAMLGSTQILDPQDYRMIDENIKKYPGLIPKIRFNAEQEIRRYRRRFKKQNPKITDSELKQKIFEQNNNWINSYKKLFPNEV